MGRDQSETLKWMGGTHTGKKPQSGIRRQEQAMEFSLTVSDTDRSAHHERNLGTVFFLQRVHRCRSFKRNVIDPSLSHQNIMPYGYKAGVEVSFSLEQMRSHFLLCGELVARLIKDQPGRRLSERTLLLLSLRKSERGLTETKVFVPCVSNCEISRKLWQTPVLTISTESGNHA